jgi:hypothetical protein
MLYHGIQVFGVMNEIQVVLGQGQLRANVKGANPFLVKRVEELEVAGCNATLNISSALLNAVKQHRHRRFEIDQ